MADNEGGSEQDDVSFLRTVGYDFPVLIDMYPFNTLITSSSHLQTLCLKGTNRPHTNEDTFPGAKIGIAV